MAWGIDRRNNSIGDVSDRREMERLNDAHKLIEWERELLRRERELLQREREILNGTLNQSQSVSPAVANKKEIADMIPEFNPSKLSSLSSNQWVRKTESIGSAYSLDGTTLALHAAMKLRGAARLWHDGAPDCATRLVYGTMVHRIALLQFGRYHAGIARSYEVTWRGSSMARWCTGLRYDLGQI
ncbi:hypothetical protein QE152_g36868 [Popillia japonica]|uniref:Uncharacterized protein n=1 Tax=Popillia japonica TaxID=7064 RepID=A0AAW1ICF9_POPJA